MKKLYIRFLEEANDKVAAEASLFEFKDYQLQMISDWMEKHPDGKVEIINWNPQPA